jgi:hypothetical protein
MEEFMVDPDVFEVVKIYTKCSPGGAFQAGVAHGAARRGAMR